MTLPDDRIIIKVVILFYPPKPVFLLIDHRLDKRSFLSYYKKTEGALTPSVQWASPPDVAIQVHRPYGNGKFP
jgi:hypothetical protein